MRETCATSTQGITYLSAALGLLTQNQQKTSPCYDVLRTFKEIKMGNPNIYNVYFFITIALLAVASVHTYPKIEASSRPNIIFVLADDLGWDDVGFHGSEIKTPHIDRLARQGVILNNYYVQPLCTPTRAAILTGKYPIHTGLQHRTIYGAQPYGLPLKEKTLAQYLKSLGYQTHAVGKWHLGFFKKEYLPTSRGFDSHIGYYLGKEDYFHHYSEDDGYSGYDFHQNGHLLWNQTRVYSTELYSAQAESIIRSHDKSKPMFLYLAHQAVHSGNPEDPIQAPQKYIDRFPFIKNMARRKFAGMVSALDDSVGRVYQALLDSGLARNTILVFSTDNGGPTNGFNKNSACNWPLRGSKSTIWQGGVRGVAFIHSPLLAEMGYVNNNLIHAVDWLPTLLSPIIKKEFVPSLKELDGINQWETLSQQAKTTRKEILVNIDPISKVEGIIVGDFKLVKGEALHGKYDGWYPPPFCTDTNGCGLNRFHIKEKIKTDKVKSMKKKHLKVTVYENVVYSNYSNETDLEDLILWMNDRHNKLNKKLDRTNKKTFSSSDAYFYSNLHKSSNVKMSQQQRSSTKFESEERSTAESIVTINCGKKPLNASTNCRPKKDACLYHLKSDPCEYNNLARLLPDIVERLERRLDFFRGSMLPPGNKPKDPMADPALHNGIWEPWR